MCTTDKIYSLNSYLGKLDFWSHDLWLRSYDAFLPWVDRCKTETAWKLCECNVLYKELYTDAEITKTLIQMKLSSHTYIDNCHYAYHKSLKKELNGIFFAFILKNGINICRFVYVMFTPSASHKVYNI